MRFVMVLQQEQQPSQGQVEQLHTQEQEHLQVLQLELILTQ